MTIALALVPNLPHPVSLNAAFLPGTKREAIKFFQKWEREIAAQVIATDKEFSIYFEVIGGYPNPKKRISITKAQASEILEDSPEETPIAPNDLLVVPEQELSIELFTGSDCATYINRIFDQENLWCNSAASQAQSNKPKFIGGNAYSLNDPEELEYRCDLLSQGEALREYAYKAWRWYFDEDSRMWRLKQMRFHSNFRLLNGVDLGAELRTSDPCWLGQVLVAEEIGS